MKILYFTYAVPKPNFPQGTFVANRINALLNNNIDVVTVTTSNIYSQYLNTSVFNNILRYWGRNYNLRDIGYPCDHEVINLLKLEYPHTYFNLLRTYNLFAIKNIYIKKKCDLIHAHFVRDGTYALSLKIKYGFPYVLTVHAYDIHTVPFYSKRMKEITIKTLEGANKVIFVSQAMQNLAKSMGYSAQNCIVINNGYDRSIFKKRRNLEVEKDQKIIGFVGVLIERKRADKLTTIMRHVLERYQKARLLIIGSGLLENEIKKSISQNNLDKYISMVGQTNQKDLVDYLNSMDVFILPSKQEGFPTVIPEALGCGVPAVVSDCAGCIEAVGDCGFVVPEGPNFEKRFAEAIVKMLKNPISEDKIAIRAKDMSWQSIIEKEISVYNDIINKKNM